MDENNFLHNKFLCEDIGFIILRNIINKDTDDLWIRCYNSIRKFYNYPIMIIDDNSDKKYISNHKLDNCFIINSEFKNRGEILPYYYYLKNPFCKRVVVLHDSMVIKKKVNFNNIDEFNNFTRLYYFTNIFYKININYFKNFCDYINNGSKVLEYHENNINKLIGCFGVCYVIDYNFLKLIDDKYNIKNLVNFIDSRKKRMTLERFLSCLFEMECCSKNKYSLFGDWILLRKRKCLFMEKTFKGR